jgi:hypothetical protein
MSAALTSFNNPFVSAVNEHKEQQGSENSGVALVPGSNLNSSPTVLNEDFRGILPFLQNNNRVVSSN